MSAFTCDPCECGGSDDCDACRQKRRDEDGPTDDGGYPKDDPKHPTYHSRMSDIWDLRDRG